MDKTLDLLVVEDNPVYKMMLWSFMDDFPNLSARMFESGLEALDYLEDIPSDKLPKAYFVDMRIPSELDVSERIHDYLKERGKLSHFYFVTANLSEHDREVVQRTGAKVFLKGDDAINLYEILRQLSHEKNE